MQHDCKCMHTRTVQTAGCGLLHGCNDVDHVFLQLAVQHLVEQFIALQGTGPCLVHEYTDSFHSVNLQQNMRRTSVWLIHQFIHLIEHEFHEFVFKLHAFSLAKSAFEHKANNPY